MRAAPALRLGADMGSISLHLPASQLSFAERERERRGREREKWSRSRRKKGKETDKERERGQEREQERAPEALISTGWGRGVEGRRDQDGLVMLGSWWGEEIGVGKGCLWKQQDPRESSRDPGLEASDQLHRQGPSLNTGRTRLKWVPLGHGNEEFRRGGNGRGGGRGWEGVLKGRAGPGVRGSPRDSVGEFSHFVTSDGTVRQPWARFWQGSASASLGCGLRQQDTGRDAAELSPVPAHTAPDKSRIPVTPQLGDK